MAALLGRFFQARGCVGLATEGTQLAGICFGNPDFPMAIT